MVKAVYIELCLLYWLQKLDYLLKRAESNIPIPVDGGCVFCTDYRNWTRNVLRAISPFPLMVVVFFVLITETGLFAETCWEQYPHSRWWWLCFLYWLQKLDYLLKRAESNIPIPDDGGCVFCTDYRNWTICWNVLRAISPFPLMVVVFFVLITETGLFAETCWEQHPHSRWWWLCFLYWLQKLDYLLKRAESNIPIPVDGGCVFCTDYRNWTICWNVLRAISPFPLMVVVFFVLITETGLFAETCWEQYPHLQKRPSLLPGSW